MSDISIVVAARNEGKTLRDCIDSLLIAAKNEAEIIIVDDGSIDTSRNILSTYGNAIKVIWETGKGPGHARNVAVSASNRPYIAFTDGDTSVEPDWLEKLAAGLNGKAFLFSSIGGPQKISSHAGAQERRIGEFLEAISFVSNYVHVGTDVLEVQHNPTCNVLYARAALEKAGGFDETIWPTEDLDLDLTLEKLGFRALYHPEAVVEHRRPPTYGGFFNMMRRYGFAHAQLVKKRGICQAIHWLPILFSIWFFLTIFAAQGWIGLLVTPLCILVAGTAFFLFSGRPLGKSLLFSYLLLGILCSWLFGFFSGLLGKRRVAKQHV